MLNLLRYLPLALVCALTAIAIGLAFASSLHWLWIGGPLAAVAAVGLYDLFHPTSNLLRIYPLLAYFRFVSEELRPEIHQYFSKAILTALRLVVTIGK